MNSENMVAIEDICLHHHTDIQFITALSDYGLVQVMTVETRQYIPLEQMRQLERLIRLHYDLDINMEGIDAIAHLLQRVEDMQQELDIIRRKLRSVA